MSERMQWLKQNGRSDTVWNSVGDQSGSPQGSGKTKSNNAQGNPSSR
jgi:hypothetical protein